MTDEDQIREAIVIWSLADADKDIEGFAGIFTEEGRFWNRRGEWRGRQVLREYLAERIARSSPELKTMHLFGEGIVETKGDHATLIAPYVAYGRIGEGPWEIMTIGRFHCELAKQGGRWLFSDMENRHIGTPGGPAARPAGTPAPNSQ